MNYQYHNEDIIKTLPENTIFVFGSNLLGRHAGGAARTACLHFGAVQGVGRGWMGQSFAIPTINEHLEPMPLSQIQHYIDEFKVYVKNHPKNQYFITSIGCGIAGYQIEEIAPMFKGIAKNVILPISFQVFLEPALPKLTQKLLHKIFRDNVIFSTEPNETVEQLNLNKSEKHLAKIILNSQLYPTDQNGRDRVFEIQDILYALNGKIFEFQSNSEGPMIFVSYILALLELYQINEKDFADVWQGEREIAAPQPANKAKKYHRK